MDRKSFWIAIDVFVY